jgi:hypothetical protein
MTEVAAYTYTFIITYIMYIIKYSEYLFEPIERPITAP